MTRHREDRALLVLQAIRDFTGAHGYTPTVRELVPMVGLASTAAVHHHLRTLAEADLIRWRPGTARSIRLVPDPVDAGTCHRPGCGNALEGSERFWCSPSCAAIAGHVRAWVRAARADHVLFELGLGPDVQLEATA